MRTVLFLLLLAQHTTTAQAVFDLWGQAGSLPGAGMFTLSGSGALREWGVSVLPGTELGTKNRFTLYGLAAARAAAGNYYFIRYTPGFVKEFRFSASETFTGPDSSDIALKANLQYREQFAAAYQAALSKGITGGIQLRYYTQEFTRDAAGVVFNPDSLYLIRETVTEEQSAWKFDISLSMHPSPVFRAGIRTSGLLTLHRGELSEANRALTLRPRRLVHGEAEYQPFDSFWCSASVNNGGGYLFGGTYSYTPPLPAFSVSLFRREGDSRAITGITAGISAVFSSWSMGLSGIWYPNSGGEESAYETFAKERISELASNQYSISKVLLGVHFFLSAGSSQKVKFIAVSKPMDIFPCLSDRYTELPFATALAVNITAAAVTVKPGSRINGLHDEIIYSPSVTIAPGDTAVLPFLTYVPERYSPSAAVLAYASFYLSTGSSEPDDAAQAPLLVQGINGWNGSVSALRWFASRDGAAIADSAKSILARHRGIFDTLQAELTDVVKARVLFDEAFTQMMYTADPTASADRVQFPTETLRLKGGDCDDFCVLATALFAAAGIECAFIDYKPGGKPEGHLQVLFNTRISPEFSYLITGNDRKYFVRNNSAGEAEMWLPLETTVRSGFAAAWEQGAERFTTEAVEGQGLATGTVALVDF